MISFETLTEARTLDRWADTWPPQDGSSHLARAVADYVRLGQRVVVSFRRVVTARGDTPRSWELATLAADIERELLALEALLDDLQAP
jgi:hypothetical protein